MANWTTRCRVGLDGPYLHENHLTRSTRLEKEVSQCDGLQLQSHTIAEHPSGLGSTRLVGYTKIFATHYQCSSAVVGGFRITSIVHQLRCNRLRILSGELIKTEIHVVVWGPLYDFFYFYFF